MAEAIITVQKTNWDRCFICQQVTKEKLIQPSLFNREHDRTGYDTIARNIPLFHEINALPILLSPTRLDEGDGIESTLKKQSKISFKLQTYVQQHKAGKGPKESIYCC